MRTTEETLTQYKNAQKTAKLNLDSVPATTRAGFGIRIRQAEQALPELKREYLTRILNNSIAFFTRGSAEQAAKFAAAAAVAGSTFTVRADACYERLADRVEPSIGRTKQFSITQVNLVNQALKELMDDTGYPDKLSSVSLIDLRVMTTRAALVSYIRAIVVKANGCVPVAVAAQNSLLKQALDTDFSGKRLAVVVTGVDPVERTTLASMFGKVISVDLPDGQEIDEGFARKVFEKAMKPKTGKADKPTEPLAPSSTEQ